MSAPENKPWHVEVSELLGRAAELAARNGVELDPFVRGAYSAYVDAIPGLRDHLAELQFKSQLEAMRKAGRLAEA